MTLQEFGLRPEVIARLHRGGWRFDVQKASAGIATLKKHFNVFPSVESALSLLWGAYFVLERGESAMGVACAKTQFIIDPLGAISEFHEEGVAWMRAIAGYLGHQTFVPFGQDLAGRHQPLPGRGNGLLMVLGNEELVYLEYADGFVRVGSPIADAINRLALGLKYASNLAALPKELEPF